MGSQFSRVPNLGMELLGHMVTLFNFGGAAELFPTVAVPFTVSSAMHDDSNVSTAWTSLKLLHLWAYSSQHNWETFQPLFLQMFFLLPLLF